MLTKTVGYDTTDEATKVRPWLLLEEFERKYLRRNIDHFLCYVKTQREPIEPVKISVKVNNVPVQTQPTEAETDFIPPTQTQKRTRKPKEKVSSAGTRVLDFTIKDRIATLINERGPLTSADIGQHFGLDRKRVSSILVDMQKQKRVFVVGHKKNEYKQLVKVLHTDQNFIYESPDVESIAPIIEEKRPARVTSQAAKERGRALVARNFRSDSIASQVFEQLCMRPRSSPELETLFRCGNSRIKFMLDRMQDLNIVEQVGQERNPTSGKLRVLWGVVDAEETPQAERVPPSLETVAKGRAMITSRCNRGGGKTMDVFDELCANGPLTRGDLAERLGCHCSMADVALRTLEKFGLIVDLGKAMGQGTGHLRRLWDVISLKEAA